MRKFYFIIILVVLTSFLLIGCSEQKPSAPAKKTVKQPTAQKQQPAEKPQKTDQSTASGKWPFVKEEDTITELAEDFTAKNYILIFDGSGSMKESNCSAGRSKIDVAKEAVVEWSKTVPMKTSLGLYAFHSNGKSILPLSTGNRDQFIQTVQNVYAGGGTPLSDAVSFAYHEFTKQAQRQLGYGEYTIVVVTDGIAKDPKRLFQYINAILSHTPINIFSIGFCIGENHSLNQPGHTIYRAADNPGQLRAGLKDVLAESESFDDTEFSN